MAKVKNSIRILDNIQLELWYDAEEEAEEKPRKLDVQFGNWYSAKKIVQNEDAPEYFDIYFDDGGIAFGVHEDIIERHGVEVVFNEKPVVNERSEERGEQLDVGEVDGEAADNVAEFEDESVDGE